MDDSRTRYPTWFGPPGDGERSVDKLGIGEHVRGGTRRRGLVDDFRLGDVECSIAFHSPGGTADVAIRRRRGEARQPSLEEGRVALVNDLHKGRHAEPGWPPRIDVTTVLLSIIAIRGVRLLLLVRRRHS